MARRNPSQRKRNRQEVTPGPCWCGDDHPLIGDAEVNGLWRVFALHHTKKRLTSYSLRNQRSGKVRRKQWIS